MARTWKGLRRIGRQLFHPFAENVLVDIEITRSLGHRNSTLLDQANRLDLNLDLVHGVGAVEWRPADSCALGRCPQDKDYCKHYSRCKDCRPLKPELRREHPDRRRKRWHLPSLKPPQARPGELLKKT